MPNAPPLITRKLWRSASRAGCGRSSLIVIWALGRLHRRSGDPERARQHLTAAKDMYGGMGMGFWLTQVDAE